LTDRAGPLTGLHALQLQGIPIDELTFTSETDAELRDLAGNAMSSTVVGCAILGALIVAAKKLSIKKSPSSINPSPILKDGLATTGELERFNQKAVQAIRIPANLLQEARNSSRKCPCEAQTLISNYDIRVCGSCKHTACRKCAGNPRHDYSSGSVIKRSTRLTPHEFVSKWRSNFPLYIRLKAPLNHLEELETTMDKDVSKPYLLAVKKAAGGRLVFQGFHRNNHWHVCYESALATMELHLLDKPEWRLYVKPSPQLPANSKLRRLLGRPVARSVAEIGSGDKSFELAWWIPSTRETRVQISGQGSQQSWRARLGLCDYVDETVCSTLDIRVQDSSALHSDLSGQYKLLSDCGTAYDSLHKRILYASSVPSQDMFFFMDPNPIGIQTHDQFVFSWDHERHQNPTYTREIAATANSEWRPWEQDKTRLVSVSEQGFWTGPKQACLEIFSADVRYYRLNKDQPKSEENSCFKAKTVLAVHFNAPGTLSSWQGIRNVAINDRYFYSHLAWPLRDGGLLGHLAQWMSIRSDSFTDCDTCSPAQPAIRWRQDLARTSKKDPRTSIKLVVQEDRLAAASYERLLKERPLPYSILTNIDVTGHAEIQISVNNLSLAHRAVSKLKLATCTNPSVEWRLDSNFVERAIMKFPRFVLRSNRNDVPHLQLDGMVLKLRPEQLRSLTWMRAQERENGVAFMCQEIEEAVHPKLGWKTEVRATADIHIKGGVLADQPSYGKTVTSLALIHAGFADLTQASSRPSIAHGLIDSQATLIVTPPHLIKQWRDEITKFLPDEYNLLGTVLVIATQADWKKYSMLQLIRAKIIILSWKVLLTEAYTSQLALFAALPQPNPGGREFKTWLEYTTASIPNAITSLLQAKDINAFAENRDQQYKINCDDARFQAAIPSRRVKGAKYVASSKSKKAAPSNAANVEFEKPKGTLKCAAGNTTAGWKGLAHPPFHLFHFDRLLVDEYALLADKLSGSERTAAYASVMQLKADKRWILSGTPALNDFVDVKAIAGLLGLNLGVDAFVPDLLGAKKLKSLRDEMSRSELFQALQESHSWDWHTHRHTQAQSFLDVFVRQNDAEIGHIKTVSQLNPVRLAPAHRAVYEELSQYLHAADMTVREPMNRGSDREEKINQSIKDAKDAEDALLRSAAAFDTNGGSDSFDDLISLRQGQLESLKLDVRALLRLAQHLRQQKSPEAEKRFMKWKSEPVEDIEAKAILQTIATKAKKDKVSDGEPAETRDEALGKMKDIILKLRPQVRELTSRIRSLRFVRAIRSLQDNTGSAGCDVCQSSVSIPDLRLMSTCGHTTCLSCLDKYASADHCLVEGCGAELDQRSIKSVEDYLDGSDLPTSRSFGAKLDNIARVLESLPEDDQVILFVPGDGLMKDATDCFEHHNISHVAIYEDEQDLLNKIENFKENSGEQQDKVLIMNLNGDHATGL
jgi:hypothetical protein